MFGIEKIISKPLLKWIYNSGKNDVLYTKIVLWSYFFIHLITVALLAWMLYQILGKKKKDKWSLIIPISCLAITLFIPYKSGDGLIDFFASNLNSTASSLTKFFAFASLGMEIGCIVLYFFDVNVTPKKEEEEREEDKEIGK